MLIREASRKDLAQIVALLSSDKLGKNRESEHFDAYQKAFETISTDPRHLLMVLTNADEVLGCFQLSFLPNLTYGGGLRAQIEGVRIRHDQRGKGLGEKMLRWAILKAQEEKAVMLQLTTDKQRPEAIAFYHKLGFISSHEGMKMKF